MFLRLVRLRTREGAASNLQEVYASRVLPALEATPGCLFAGLLRHDLHPEEHLSLTLWTSGADAATFERRGVFHHLLRQVEPFLAASTEWRVRLAEDPEETADVSRREIPSQGFAVGAVAGEDALRSARRTMFVRIVSVRVAGERREEFRRIYRDEVMPALRRSRGCRGVFLAEGTPEPEHVLSVTVWDREENALRYEASGEFERLTLRLRDTYAPLQQWGMDVGAVVTPEVKGYYMVAGRSLGAS